MYYIITLIRSKTTIIFIITVLAVIFLEYDLLKPAFEIGLTPEDREFILRFKTFAPNPLTKIFEVWSERGAYSTIPIYYLGTLESFTGFNYPLIQFVGIFFRTLATLSIFPLVLIVFKNKWLATFTAILVAISYPTTGALETGVEQSEYLGFLTMNVFLIVYYYLNTRYLLQIKWLILSSLILFIAVMISVMRVYPILFLLPVIEIYLWFWDRARYKFRYLVIKLLAFYLPFLILVYYFPFSATGHFILPTILSKISDGNWQLILTPLQGLGFMVPVSGHYGKLGFLDLNSFDTYLIFLLGSPLVIFGVGSFLLSWIITRNPLSLFLRIFSLSFGLGLLTYWIVQHRLLIPSELRLNYDVPRLYPVFFGLFILALALNFFIEWYKQGRKNNLFLVLWLGPFISLFYITATYLYASLNLSFAGAQDHYLLIPTLGISLMIAGILLSLHNKLSKLKYGLTASIFIISAILLILYLLNKELTHDYFNGVKLKGRAASGQIEMQTKIKQKLKNLDYTKPILVYFDTSDITGHGPFYSEGFLTPFSFFMHFQDNKIVDGCIGIIYEDNKMIELQKIAQVQNSISGLVYRGLCVNEGKSDIRNLFFTTDHFYAFKIKGQELVDIKDQVLDQLNFR